MTDTSVTLEREGDVAVLMIYNPPVNALSHHMRVALSARLNEAEADSEVRAIVIAAKGTMFCAGADVKQLNMPPQNPQSPDIFLRMASLTKPVVAAIHGAALGGGFEMVLGADIVIASTEARFGLPEARVGRLPLDGGMVALQRLIPRNIAAGLMMTGRMLSAQEAAQFGLVNAVVPPDRLDAEVDAWVADILSCAPLSVAAIKDTIRSTAHLNPHEARDLRRPALIAALQSEDSIEGVAAFREKRAPVWRGR